MRDLLLERTGRDEFPEFQLVLNGAVMSLHVGERSFDSDDGPHHVFPCHCASLTGRLDDFTDEELRVPQSVARPLVRSED